MSSKRLRVRVGGEQERAERLGPPLDRAFGRRARLVHVDPVRCDAHEHVRPRAERSSPVHVTSPSVGWSARYSGERRDDEAVVVLHRVRLGDDTSEPRLRHLVVGAVHEQHPAAGQRASPSSSS